MRVAQLQGKPWLERRTGDRGRTGDLFSNPVEPVQNFDNLPTLPAQYLSKETLNLSKTSKGSFYIVQYAVCWIAQSALHLGVTKKMFVSVYPTDP